MESDRSPVGDTDREGDAPAGSTPPDPRRRRDIIISLVVVAVLVLVVAIGGSILAYRALSPEPGAAEGAITEESTILETAGGTIHDPLADAAARCAAGPDRSARTLDPLVATDDLAPATTKDNTL